ncbi:hypothetical protein ABTZ78_06250 [Streptomyces bauhiniae]|uniref:hypothetical protein n=1 Tax=Streptomyces bauhiniae TaxID=2340725 RepID=UPI00332045BF
MPEYMDNPAGRLRTLLLDVHQASPNRNVLAWDVIAKVLVPAHGPSSSISLAAMAHLLELPSQIRAAVDMLDEDAEEKEHLLENLDKVQSFLSQVANRNTTLDAAFQLLVGGGDIPNSAAVQSLAHCSRRLHRLSPEPDISYEEVDELIQSVTGLMADIRESSLDGAAKGLLLHHLHRLLQALDLIRITGSAPVEESLDAFLMAAQRHPEVMDEVRGRGFGERLASIANVIRSVFGITQGVHQLGTEVHAVLQQGAHAVGQAGNLLQ